MSTSTPETLEKYLFHSCSTLLSQLNLKSGACIDLNSWFLPHEADLPAAINNYIGIALQDCSSINWLETAKNQLNTALQGKSISVIIAVDLFNHCPQEQVEQWLDYIWSLSNTHQCPVVCGVPNASHTEWIYRLLEISGNSLQDFPLLDQRQFFTEPVFTNLMQQQGYKAVGEADLQAPSSLEHADQPNDIFSAWGSITHTYLQWLKQSTDLHADTIYFLRAYQSSQEKVIRKQKQRSTPFLSVITRTQGKRIDALEETLLCLSAQTNTDFEVLLMGHNVAVPDKQNVLELISQTPSWIREKIRYIDVQGGTRTTPLNQGFRQARGEYIVILDDDDLITDDWVQTFYQLFLKSPGAILHAYGVAQEWKTIRNKHNETALRATGQPVQTYCKDFNLLEQLNLNFCPTMTYACPRYAFQTLGIQFNEEFTTTEDWDFLMRTALVCGVTDAQNVTSIYRLWTNNENSQTLHNREEWIDNEKKIKQYLSEVPIVFPAGSLTKKTSDKSKTSVRSRCYRTYDSALYLDNGNGFSEDNTISGQDCPEPDLTVGFEIPENCESVCALRFDPMEDGLFWLKNFKMDITLSDGSIVTRRLKKCTHNGISLKNGILFYKQDPQIQMVFKSPMNLQSVTASFEIDFYIPEQIWAEAFLRPNWKLWRPFQLLTKLKQKLWR